jgi:hypothetical protein
MAAFDSSLTNSIKSATQSQREKKKLENNQRFYPRTMNHHMLRQNAYRIHRSFSDKFSLFFSIGGKVMESVDRFTDRRFVCAEWTDHVLQESN